MLPTKLTTGEFHCRKKDNTAVVFLIVFRVISIDSLA